MFFFRIDSISSVWRNKWKKEYSNSQNVILNVTDRTALGNAERVLTPVIVTMWTGNVLKVVNLVGSQSCVKMVYNETHITSVDKKFPYIWFKRHLIIFKIYILYISFIVRFTDDLFCSLQEWYLRSTVQKWMQRQLFEQWTVQ